MSKEWIAIGIGVASLIVSSLTLVKGIQLRSRLIHISVRLGSSLNAVRSGIERIERVVDGQDGSSADEVKKTILSARNDMERRVRRAMLFDHDQDQTYGAIMWFFENGCPDDAASVQYALNFRCFRNKKNKMLAKELLEHLKAHKKQ